MSEMVTIARPYAKAAFDLAVDKGELDQWSQMLTFAAEVARNDTIKTILAGTHSASELAEIFISVCGKQLNEFGQNLIKIMAENNRLTVLPAVAAEFMVFRHEYEKQIDVNVISAVVLTKEQQAAIASKMEARLERKVKLSCSVDETLLAGIIIRAGDLIIDNSVSGRIHRLSETLQS